MSARLCCLAAILTLAGTGAAGAADRFEDGHHKAVQCVACHGIEGVAANPTFPHLAGQNAAYLAIQLERFRTGQRYHPLMTPVAQALSDRDIEDLATYYGGLRPWIETRSEP
jgi:cytochrome c553